MKMSDKLKERFVRDYRIPIKLFSEPYFTDRILLYDKYFGTLKKWNDFKEMLKNYKNEEEYFSEYNRVKDDAINYIKSTEAYKNFNEIDMNQFAITNKNISNHDIFHSSNIGRHFISIDMRKANFSSLRHFDPMMFDNAKTWEDFLRNFTNNEHIINSKYIREVILGNCNPKRHITYEKYLMDSIINKLIEATKLVEIEDFKKSIVFFSNDEIIFDVTDYKIPKAVMTKLNNFVRSKTIPIRKESFVLKGIRRKDTGEHIGYIRCLTDGTMDFKCVNNLTFPFVLRKLNDQIINKFDMVFEYEGMLAAFISPIEIEIIERN